MSTTIALPDHISTYKTRLDGMLTERIELDRRLAAAVQTGGDCNEIADLIRTLDGDTERTRLMLGAAERAAADEQAAAAVKAKERDRKALEKRHAATVEAALAFEALMLGPAVEAWERFLDAQEAELADTRRLSHAPPASGYSKPARVWASVIARWLRECGQSPVEPLRESATPMTLTALYGGQEKRPGASPVPA